MPTKNYTRKTDSNGLLASPANGAPNLVDEVKTALPTRTWMLKADGTNVAVEIDGGALTGTEDTDLDTAYTNWSPTVSTKFESNFEVSTISKGKMQKTEWFETDNGNGTYSDLAVDKVYTWSGNNLISIVTTNYYTDGSIIGIPITESYYTTSDNKHVTKITP